MKKYLLTIFIGLSLVCITPSFTRADTTNLSVSDIKTIINILIAIGVIPQDKIATVNILLAQLENSNGVVSAPPKPYLISVSRLSAHVGDQVTVTGSNLIISAHTGSAVVIGSVRISDLTGGIVSATNQSITFVIPPTLSPGTYNLYVTGYVPDIMNGGGTTINSNSVALTIIPFIHTQPSITVISPDGGEIFKQSSPITVKWSQNFSAYTSICLMGDAGCVYNSTPVMFNSGINTWTIPANTKVTTCIEVPSYRCYIADGYKVMVTTDNQPGSGHVGEFMNDQSDNYFTIVQ